MSGDIYAQRYDVLGAPVGSDFVVTDTDYASDHDVALEADGDFVAVWEYAGEIYGRRFDANAGSLGATFQVNTYTTSEQEDPAVASLADGTFVVAWHGYGETDPSSYNAGVFARRYGEEETIPITGKKLIVIDKVAVAGKAKIVFIAKGDAAIDKGIAGDKSLLSGSFDVFYTDQPGVVSGSFTLPSPWRTNTAVVGKYVNNLAPNGGPGGVKVAAIKTGVSAKVRTKSLGDGPVLDISSGGPSSAGGVTVVLTLSNAADGTIRKFCSKFAIDSGSDVIFKELAGGLARKLIARAGVPTACP